MPNRARMALIGAGAGAVTMLLIWAAAFHTHLGAQADQSVFLGFAELQRPRVNGVANVIAQICNPAPFIVLSTVVVCLAFARGRARLAIVVGAILLGATVTTEALKPLLAQTHPHWMIPAAVPVHPASWPSGHATAAMSLTLALVLVAPARRRPLVAAAGAVFVVAVCYSFLTLAWHYPSDVLGGYLVAVMWTQLALAALFALDARRAGRLVEADHALSLRAALTPPAAAVIGAGALVVLVALARPHAVITFAHLHKIFLVGAAGIGALALALATAVVLGIRASAGSPPAASPDRRSRARPA
jgi:membrane-associated phospholipid phosphatase